MDKKRNITRYTVYLQAYGRPAGEPSSDHSLFSAPTWYPVPPPLHTWQTTEEKEEREEEAEQAKEAEQAEQAEQAGQVEQEDKQNEMRKQNKQS